MSKEKIEHPCEDCKDETKCVERGKYKKCERWLEWFGQQWRTLQKKFARDVSNRHDEKESDDE